MSTVLRVGGCAGDRDALARLVRGRPDGPMLLGQLLCWIGRGAIGGAVREATRGRGTMLEERHRIERSGPAGPADCSWNVAADVLERSNDRLLVHTWAAAEHGGGLSADVHLLAIGDATVPPRRTHQGAPARIHRAVTFSGADLDAYVALSGDDNILHVDPDAASRAGLRERAVHGALVAAAIEDTARDWAQCGEPASISARFVGVLLAGETLDISLRDLGRHDGRRIVRGLGTCGPDLVCSADLAFDLA